jgi:hypothetical protein
VAPSALGNIHIPPLPETIPDVVHVVKEGESSSLFDTQKDDTKDNDDNNDMSGGDKKIITIKN